MLSNSLVPWLRRAVLSALVLVLLLGPRVDVCAAPSHGQEDPGIRLWYSLPSQEAGPFEALVARFNQSHAHAQLQTRNFSSMDELRAALAAGAELPQLALIDSTWQAELLQGKRIVAAEDLLNKMGVMAKIILKADTFPGMWEAVQVDGKCCTLPLFATCHALIYDVERLQTAGIKVPPKNWWEVIQASRKMARPAEHEWGFVLPTQNLSPRDAARMFQIYRLQAGASPATADNVAWLDGPECVAVLQHWLDLVHKYKSVSPDVDGGVDKAAMYIGTMRDLLDAQAKGRRVQAVPLPAHKALAADITVYALAIFASDDRSKMDRMWEAGVWLSEFQQMLEFSMVSGYIPANKQITLSPGYFQFLQAHPGLRSFLAQLRNCRPDPTFPGYVRSLDVLGQALKKAVESNGSAQETLTGARQRAEAVLKSQGGSTTQPTGAGG